MPKKSFTDREPADRHHHLALSDAEVLILVKWHAKVCHRCSRACRDFVRSFGAGSPFAADEKFVQAGRNIRAQHQAHSERGGQLSALIGFQARPVPKFKATELPL
jgi:hypothetical protein